MAQKSLWWTTNGTGDGGTEYTQAEWFRFLRQIFVGDDTDEGVLKGYENELEVTGSTSPVAVNTGGAIVYGSPYWNTASANVVVPTPSATTREDYIVLQMDWSAQTVRIARVAGTEGAGLPSLTQTDGVTWEIPLAEVTILTDGNLSVTDVREFVHPNIEVETAMLEDNAVTNAKIRDSAALTVIGRASNSTGGPADIAASSDNTVLRRSGTSIGFGTIDHNAIASRTRSFFVPALTGYDVTGGGVLIELDHGGTIGPTIPLPDSKIGIATGRGMVPSDYASGLSVEAVLVTAADDGSPTGNSYGRVRIYGAADGETYGTNAATGSYEAITISNDHYYYMTTTVNGAGTLAAGDVLMLDYQRDATHGNDTVGGVVRVVGFIVSYTADM